MCVKRNLLKQYRYLQHEVKFNLLAVVLDKRVQLQEELDGLQASLSSAQDVRHDF